MAWSSPVPVGCRPTSNFGRRGSSFHAGDDYAPPKPGQQGVPVYAVGDGTVIGDGAGLLSGHSGDRNLLIQHPGGVISYYGHLQSNSVSKGQKVKGGQQIGVMGHRGNVVPAGPNGTHLHQGLIVGGSFVDPSAWLSRKGITVGRTAPVKQASKPKPTPADGGVHRLTASVKAALTRMGLPPTVEGIKSYQRAMGLTVDGIWGTKETEPFYKATYNLQRALNAIRKRHDLPVLVVDGYLGAKTKARIKEARSKYGFGAYPHTNPAFRAWLSRKTGIKL